MKAILTKLLAVQAEVGAISKDSTNPFFKSKYFDINSLLEHVKPLLTKHGLVLLQPIKVYDGVTGLVTSIMDCETGKEVVSFMPLPKLDDPQKMGSAITYFRRYALQSLLALQAEDDDGNGASRPTVQNSTLPSESVYRPSQASGPASQAHTGNTYAPLELADVMRFGKHKGKTVGQVVKEAPDYIDWMLDQGKTKFSPSVLEAMKGSGDVHGTSSEAKGEPVLDDLPF